MEWVEQITGIFTILRYGWLSRDKFGIGNVRLLFPEEPIILELVYWEEWDSLNCLKRFHLIRGTDESH